MHIPDGFLGPETCIAGFAAMAPIWAISSYKMKKDLSSKQVPLLAMGAAFSFVIMMFNFPIPRGTTGHAVGAVLVAVLLGPWAATISISTALIIQALLFGDGGISTIGANCFNIAFVMSFVGYGIYRIISGKSGPKSFRRIVGASIGAYIALAVASMLAGFEFGIQPLLNHTDIGQALYCPYSVKVAVPTMLGEHLLVFGWVELAVTAIVLKFIQSQEPSLLEFKRKEK